MTHIDSKTMLYESLIHTKYRERYKYENLHDLPKKCGHKCLQIHLT